MLNRLPALATLGLALLLIVLSAAAYWIGRQLEQLSYQLPNTVQLLSFQRGWFKSQATARLDLAAPLASEHTIYHGLLPLKRWPQPGLVHIHTRLTSPRSAICDDPITHRFESIQ